MATSDLHALDATVLAQKLRSRDITAESIVRSCLERLATRDREIGAWAFVDAEGAIRSAQHLDRGPITGPLHGLPVAFKDVFDTAGMPTEYGSPIYKAHRPVADAAVVALTRRAGGILLGKTVTTEFAYRRPAHTRHPLRPTHTPGGSSSGSAAAVSDQMVPLAFGTQTGGSTIRPAAYCGIVGYVPTFGAVSRVGVKVLAESVDSVGLLARSVADVALLLNAVTGIPVDFPAVSGTRLRVGLCRTPHWEMADAAVRSTVERAAALLTGAGVTVTEAEMPGDFGRLWSLQPAVVDHELARAFAYEYDAHRASLSLELREAIERGWTVTRGEYDAARSEVASLRQSVLNVLANHDLLLTLGSPGEAPEGLADTGSAVFNRVWSLLGMPSVTVPVGEGPRGLPLGIQLVALPGKDMSLLAHAQWVQEVLRKANLQGSVR